MELQRQKSERRTTTHSDQACQIAGPKEWMQGRWLHRNCIKDGDQVSRHDVRFLKVKTDQCEIGEPGGKQCASHEVDPVSLLQVSRCKRVSCAFFQLMRARVKNPCQDQSPKTKQSRNEQDPKTGSISAMEIKYQRHE